MRPKPPQLVRWVTDTRANLSGFLFQRKEKMLALTAVTTWSGITRKEQRYQKRLRPNELITRARPWKESCRVFHVARTVSSLARRFAHEWSTTSLTSSKPRTVILEEDQFNVIGNLVHERHEPTSKM